MHVAANKTSFRLNDSIQFQSHRQPSESEAEIMPLN